MIETARCVILGGGGHSQVVIDSLQASGQADIRGVLDANPARWGEEILGIPILGGDDLLPRLAEQGIDHFIVGIGATGDNRPRQRLYELGLAHNLKPLTVTHPSAINSPWAKVGPGSQLLPGSIVNAGAELGANVIINSGAIVEHDCRLGDQVHLATAARLCSTTTVDTGAHIGAGATVKQCITIGEWAIVGAGAVVVRDVAPHTLVVGVPARWLRDLVPEADASNREPDGRTVPSEGV